MTERPLRRILLALVVLGILGLTVELWLLEHTESLEQTLPFAALGAGLVSAVGVAAWPRRTTLRVFQGIMILFVAVGLLGLYLHWSGNAEFELERQPELHGIGLWWEALRGATPALAPAALSQLGLLGLAFTFRHPALEPDRSRISSHASGGSAGASSSENP